MRRVATKIQESRECNFEGMGIGPGDRRVALQLAKHEQAALANRFAPLVEESLDQRGDVDGCRFEFFLGRRAGEAVYDLIDMRDIAAD
jgi:hypothetical protein